MMQATKIERPDTLHMLPAGTRVADSAHDLWTKQPDGTWEMDQDTSLAAEHLLHVWGPVNIIPREGV